MFWLSKLHVYLSKDDQNAVFLCRVTCTYTKSTQLKCFVSDLHFYKSQGCVIKCIRYATIPTIWAAIVEITHIEIELFFIMQCTNSPETNFIFLHCAIAWIKIEIYHICRPECHSFASHLFFVKFVQFNIRDIIFMIKSIWKIILLFNVFTCESLLYCKNSDVIMLTLLGNYIA